MLIVIALLQAATVNPGPKPMDAQTQVLSELRATLRDPYSMIDLRICEPRPLGEWWVVFASLKSNNGYGGYGETQGYAYQFVNGKRGVGYGTRGGTRRYVSAGIQGGDCKGV